MKNSFYIGFFVGLLVCVLAYFSTVHTNIVQQLMPGKPAGLYVIAAGLNFIGVWAAYRNGYDNVGKGLVFVTFIALLLAVFTKSLAI